MKNIYLNNTQIHSNTDNSLGFAVDPDISGLEQPTIRLPSFVRPNIDGGVVPSQLYGGRLVGFRGTVYANDVDTHLARRRSLESAVNIQKIVTGGFNPVTLKFTTNDNLALQTSVYTRKFDFPLKYLLGSRYKAEFFAPSIYLLSQIEKSSIIYVFNAGGFAVPFGVPFDMNNNSASITTLNNAGNLYAIPKIIVTAPLQNPTITNETTGEVMSITYTLTSSQYLEIDCDLHTVLYYSAPGASPTNVRDKVSGDFITLAPGDNIIKLTVATFDSGNIQITWRDSYSGV